MYTGYRWCACSHVRMSSSVTVQHCLLVQMGEFTLLPDGRVFLCNGGQIGMHCCVLSTQYRVTVMLKVTCRLLLEVASVW